MTISSMTGFARTDGAADGLTWAWEARSVNGRGLDVRLRLPPGNDGIEQLARDAVSKRFSRGNISLSLAIERQSSAGAVRLNESVLFDVLRAADRVIEVAGGSRPDTAALLGMKGVLEVGENGVEDPDKRAQRERALLANLDLALDQLMAARRTEGDKLAAIITEQVKQIEALTSQVRASPSRTPDAIRARIEELVARLVDTSDSFDSARLHQEAVLAATRADVEEELARLQAHVSAAREILSESGAVGRKLDFLAQEFNREANTLCSKANAVDVTRLGLALKTVIDQLREQVQNVE
ncbi:MAG: YicC family protein [Hyphomicrobium sp.]|nr:MAG: YicC family protein [Hyphomicrobium sp.]PPC99660.1 MAG: YicC family protein [Hyphomicrobium sp.]